MLARFLTVDRPSFILTFHGANNPAAQEDFFIHNAGVQSSLRFRRLNQTFGTSLRDVDLSLASIANDENDAKRPRHGVAALLAASPPMETRVVPFHSSWLPAYRELCPDESEPMYLLLMHLYSGCADGVVCPRDKSKRCRVDDAIRKYQREQQNNQDQEIAEEEHPTEDDIFYTCTNNTNGRGGGSYAHVLIVLLELFEWFHCPEYLSWHVQETLVRHTIYSDATVQMMPHLLRLLYDPNHVAIAMHIERACHVLLFCTQSPVNALHLVNANNTGPGVSTLISLQTVCPVHRLHEFDSDNGMRPVDIAISPRYTLEHLIDEAPLVCTVERETEYACGGGVCICVNHTESCLRVVHARPDDIMPCLYEMFEFAAIRDLRYIDNMHMSDCHIESFRLRSEHMFLHVSFWIDSSEYVHVQVETQISGNVGTAGTVSTVSFAPRVQLSLGVLNVIDSSTLDMFDAELDGSIEQSYRRQPSVVHSDMVHLDSKESAEQHARTKELNITRHTTSHHSSLSHAYTTIWRLCFDKVRSGRQTRNWNAYNNVIEGPPMPPRLFYLQGTVSFPDPSQQQQQHEPPEQTSHLTLQASESDSNSATDSENML